MQKSERNYREAHKDLPTDNKKQDNFDALPKRKGIKKSTGLWWR